MLEPQGDGRTRRAHLEHAARFSAPGAAEALAGPALPEEFADLWMGFVELGVSRPMPKGVPQRFSYAELDAWARLTGRSLSPTEVAILRELDALWLAPAKD
jgi:hypothetical protein